MAMVTPKYLPMVEMGAFALLSGKLVVTDPCYSPGTWCAGELKAKDGVWRARMLPSDEGEGFLGGRRVAELQISHVDHNGDLPKERVDITVGVDSGQAGFFCAETYAKVWESEYGEPGFYGTVCTLTSGAQDGGVVGFGVASSSGFGDGSYDCFVAKDERGDVVAARIVFIAPYDDEENEEDVQAAA